MDKNGSINMQEEVNVTHEPLGEIKFDKRYIELTGS
jgi:hypothetical protein